MFGSLGMPELIVIFVVALVVFGPSKLPELGKSLGEAIRGLRKSVSEADKPSFKTRIRRKKTKEIQPQRTILRSSACRPSSSSNLTRLRNEDTSLRNRQGFERSQLTELTNTNFESWRKESFVIATKIAYRNGSLSKLLAIFRSNATYTNCSNWSGSYASVGRSANCRFCNYWEVWNSETDRRRISA